MIELISQIEEYYTRKVEQFGATAKGVDWNSEESQQLRFKKLMEVIENGKTDFTLLDYGCGTGALYSYSRDLFKNLKYTGYDVSAAMLSAAKKNNDDVTWLSSLLPGSEYDYVLCSGVFNVRLEASDNAWLDFMQHTIKRFDSLSTSGFAFNVLSLNSDPGKRKDYLYYADPVYWKKFCRQEFSGHVTLLENYSLYEFTILVNK